MADKTQVFPLDPNDSVRTRLTHSHEVANLCRSVGTTLAYGALSGLDESAITRNVPAILAAAGLAHDLGNPPFGHSGERAIQHWFTENPQILKPLSASPALQQDFLLFEGNAQTLRLLTRLQVINDSYGLNLTFATLAAVLKYPTPSDRIDDSSSATKKHGFFQSELKIVESIWNATGLTQGHRHPFTYVMEACDDIAYAVLDAEDAVKKGLASFADLMAFLRHEISRDSISDHVINDAEADHHEYRRQYNLSPSELNDISMQKFRVYAVGLLVDRACKAFEDKLADLLQGTFRNDLLRGTDAQDLCNALKKFDRMHAYRHRSVLAIEVTGFNVVQDLMQFLWYAIQNRSDGMSKKATHASPFAAYAYQRISENYRRVFDSSEDSLPPRYRELQLLTDMIAGMTDSYAVAMRDDLKSYYKA